MICISQRRQSTTTHVCIKKTSWLYQNREWASLQIWRT